MTEATNAHAHGAGIGEHEHEGGALDHMHDVDGKPIHRELDLSALSREVRPADRPTRQLALAIIAQDTPPEDLEAFIGGLTVERIPFWVLRLREIEATAEKVRQALEVEWGLRAGGLSWKDPDSEQWYDYRGSHRGGFTQIPDLVAQLQKRGVTADEIARAISGIRVTDLETMADERTGKIGCCQHCGELMPLEDIASGGHPVSAHAGDESCRQDRHANCPIQELCGPVDEIPKAQALRAIIREHYEYTEGPKHLTKREERHRGKRG
jgi:hypothetical protein